MSLFSGVILAQNSYLSLGVDVAIPNNNFKALATTGFGGSLRYEYTITPRFSITGTVHVDSFGKKVYASPPYKYTFKTSLISYKVGGRFYLFNIGNKADGLFLSGELGLATLGLTVSGDISDKSSENDFCYAPGIGYRYEFLEFCYWQQFVSSSSGNSTNFSGFRLAYVLKLKKPG